MSANLQCIALLAAEVMNLHVPDEFGPVIVDVLVFTSDCTPVNGAIIVDVFYDDGRFS